MNLCTVLLNKLIYSVYLETQCSVIERHVQSIDVKVCDHVDIFSVSMQKRDSFPSLSKPSLS